MSVSARIAKDWGEWRQNRDTMSPGTDSTVELSEEESTQGIERYFRWPKYGLLDGVLHCTTLPLPQIVANELIECAYKKSTISYGRLHRAHITTDKIER